MPSHLVNNHLQHIAKQEAKFGADSEEVAVALKTLAKLVCQYEDPADALPYFERSIRIREALHGPESILKELDDWIDKNSRHFELIEPFLQKRLAIETAALGEIDPRIADECEAMAKRYRHHHRYSAARALLERSLAIRETNSGPESAEVAATLELLFEACLRSKQGDAADDHLERCIEIKEKVFGEDSEEVARTLLSLAAAYLNSGKLEAPRSRGGAGKASPLFDRGLALMDALFGEESPEARKAVEAAARAYLAGGGFRQAQPLLNRLLSLNEKAYGEDAAELLWILTELAESHANHQSAMAEPLLKRSFAILRSFLDAKKAAYWESASSFSESPQGILERLVRASERNRSNLRERWGG
jgi:tetratricopeptide (TPR) repeat protein